jgi:hypothetical protein
VHQIDYNDKNKEVSDEDVSEDEDEDVSEDVSEDEDYDGPRRDLATRLRRTKKFGVHTPQSQKNPCLVRPHPCRYLPKKGTGNAQQEVARAAAKQEAQKVKPLCPSP